MESLNDLTANLVNRVGNVLPDILGALLVLIIGLLVAAGIRKLVMAIFKRTKLDEKIGAKMHTSFRVDKFVAKLVYYLVVLYVLLLVLSMLGVNNVLAPLQDMFYDFVSFLPNIVAAGIIGFAGYVIAKLVSQAAGFAVSKVKAVSNNMGMEGSSVNIVSIVEKIVFIFVFIPILIVALDTLKMDAISGPATNMLDSFMAAIPKIIAAAVILTVFYFVGKWIISLLVSLLQGLGVDNLSNRLGLDAVVGNTTSLSKMIGNVAFFFLMFTGVIAAVERLEMYQINEVLSNLLEITGRIFFGLIILAIGNYISNLAADAIRRSEDSSWLSSIVRITTLGIFLAISLSAMGIADDIVNLAFGLILGAVAVAIALSFGLGGREAAGKQMEYWLSRFRNEKNTP